MMEREEIVCDSFKVQKRYLENLAGKRSIRVGRFLANQAFEFSSL